jgi:hypothetical protein
MLAGVTIGSCVQGNSDAGTNSFDVAIVGGTPAGIMAAVASARLGAKVVLLEYHNHIGGMSSSGLGKSDIEKREAIAGLFKEFTGRVLAFYTEKYGAGSDNVKLCRGGYYYEPSVAEFVFNRMIGEEESITLWVNHQLADAVVVDDQITAAVFLDRSARSEVTVKAKVFVDATYEGDLFALAGAAFRLGREGKNEFNEPHAGQIFFDYNEKVFLEGSTGEGDNKLPAYTYRLCLTDDPDNSYVLADPPSGYDRNNYTGYFSDLHEGRLDAPKSFNDGHGFYAAHFGTMMRVFSFSAIPNRKYDVNINPRPLGFPFAEQNYIYPEADWATRELIFEHHRGLTLGLLYFVQNDPEVPEEHRALARQYHLPLDEFHDNGHFPWQLYVREARRLKGQYTLSENDVVPAGSERRSTIFKDAIISGEFPIDSFPVSRSPSPGQKVLEGYIGLLGVSPYQVPYRILIPAQIKGLIVPVAVSTSHVAYSTVRMEPLWMGIGQAAGIAAQIANDTSVDVRDVPVQWLQRLLIEQGQVLTYFDDLDPTDKGHKATQFWGTKGFFENYRAAYRESLTGTDMTKWLTIAGAELGVDVEVPANSGAISVNDLVLELEKLNASSVIATELSWLYSDRDRKSPVFRGEACMALFELFFESFDEIPTQFRHRRNG